MRVLVTGGTGYLGSHIVGALRREGHDVRVLARSPERVAPALTPLGIDPADVEVAVGDVLDRASMDAAVDGADAMINAANVYSMDVRDAERMRHVNRTGTEVALTAAVEGGLSPVVHISSYVALLPSTVPLTSASPTGDPEGAYLVSKADSERSRSSCGSRERLSSSPTPAPSSDRTTRTAARAPSSSATGWSDARRSTRQAPSRSSTSATSRWPMPGWSRTAQTRRGSSPWAGA